jgi:hypothetical protein
MAENQRCPSMSNPNSSALEIDPSQPAIEYFSQEEIKRRMEEDRERVIPSYIIAKLQHKLLRESIWMIPQDAGPDAEFDMMFETTSSFGDDDLEYMHEENVKKRAL